MMDEYDVVICGSGLVECILSLLLSQEGNFSSMFLIFKPFQKAKKFFILIETLSLVEKGPHLTWHLSGNYLDLA